MPNRTLTLTEIQAEERDHWSEARFQDEVRSIATRHSWKYYHVYDARRSNPGFPDTVLARNGRVIFMELKRVGQKPTKAQQSWLDTLPDAHWFTPRELPQIREMLS